MENILIIKIGAIGDIIMALPTLREIKKDYPKSHITWACGSIVRPILEAIPEIDRVVSIDEKQLFSGRKIHAIKEIFLYYKTIFSYQFNLVINFHHDKRYSSLHKFLRKDRVLILSRDGERPKLIPGRSRAFEHFRLYKAFDKEFEGYLEFPSDNLPDSLNNDLSINGNGKKVVVIAPGGANNVLNEQALRRWPIEHYYEVIKHLNTIGIIVVVTGAPSDSWVLKSLEGLEFINLVGRLNIVELIVLFRNSDVVLTHDSGPFHLAVFAAKPSVLALFGPTNPREFDYKIRGSKINIIWGGENLQCAPCYFGKNFALGCNNNICMKDIDPTSVIKKIDRIILQAN